MTLPRIDDLLAARAWLQAGAPAAARGHEPKRCVRTLLLLLEELPAKLPVYCHGTPEHRAQRVKEHDPYADGPSLEERL